MGTRIWAQHLDDTLIFTSSTSRYPLPEATWMRAVPGLILPFSAPTMEIRIWALQLDNTFIFSYTDWGYRLPEIRRMRAVPRPWTRPWNSYYPPYVHSSASYVIPPRLRRPQSTYARRPIAVETSSYNYETTEQQNLQHGENPSQRDGNGLSAECIFEFLMGTLGCPRTEEEICTICQDEIQMEEEMTTLSCSHVYHMGCIRKWLRIKNECAVCRASVISKNEEY